MAGSSLTKRNRRLKVHRGDQTWTSRPTTAPGDRGWESDDSAAWSAGERAANMSASAKSAEKARPKQPGHRGELICASQAKKAATTEQLRNADTYRRNQLSRMPLDLDGWDVHAALSGNDPAITHGGLFDWSIQDSGRVGLAAASAMGTGLAAAFASASLLSALRAHGSHPHTPDEMLGRLNQATNTPTHGTRFWIHPVDSLTTAWQARPSYFYAAAGKQNGSTQSPCQH